LEQKECLAGAPRIYGQLVSILGRYSKFASAGDKAAVRTAVDALNRERTGDMHHPDAEVTDGPAAESTEAASEERKDAPF
jgi:myo-inositol-1(or 4)-monophosphatase